PPQQGPHRQPLCCIDSKYRSVNKYGNQNDFNASVRSPDASLVRLLGEAGPIRPSPTRNHCYSSKYLAAPYWHQLTHLPTHLHVPRGHLPGPPPPPPPPGPPLRGGSPGSPGSLGSPSNPAAPATSGIRCTSPTTSKPAVSDDRRSVALVSA